MRQYKALNLRVDIFEDLAFEEGASDNFCQYDCVYIEQSEYRCSSIYGIKIFEEDLLIRSAVIGSHAGRTGITDNATILEDDRLVICCSDSVFCLSIPSLKLLWQTKADLATCFGTYKYQDSYIIHGELEISRLDQDGKILWQKGGEDIFVTLEATEHFKITQDYILATDWNNRTYIFDFDGNVL